ncbi:helix-turn-helix transcriptional regulator [Planomonospora sp. ID67723]|uniref:helix-turn-helix domain-containing protein n=1 Tax=Planomonospora sp. ID67723 TaxID=2738134 RepID=UPI0018C4088E|nr:helix-turn-helix transcriptional regulator [Planomonospora sp. ID67723]MBG0826919.1 helix-turn-helix transcriptional regulator [Planomonospora sp. ID67723]
MPSQGTIGDRVRGLRLSRRMSQAQLAGPDLSDSYVSLIESGKRTPTPVVARLLAERLGCTTEFLLHGIEPRQRIDTELGLRHAELELHHGDPAVAAERFGEIVKAAGEENAMLAAHARLGRARALEAQGMTGPAVEAFERLRREATAHPERLANLPLTVALSRCYRHGGDVLRARDLAAAALTEVNRLALTQGEIAVDLAASLLETEAPHSPGLAFVRRVVQDNGVPAAVSRDEEIHALWQASVTAAEGEDSSLAVRLADDAIAAGRPARMTVKLACIAMKWSRLASAFDGEPLDRVRTLATAASEVFGSLSRHGHDHAESLVVLASVELKSGDLEGAARLSASVLDLPGSGSRVIGAGARLVLAEVALARSHGSHGSHDTVLSHLHAARDLLSGSDPVSGVNRESARAWRRLGDLYGQAGAPEEQTSAYRKALEAVGVHSVLVGVTVDSALAR